MRLFVGCGRGLGVGFNAPCAGGGHFVTCMSLRGALPLVTIAYELQIHRSAYGGLVL